MNNDSQKWEIVVSSKAPFFDLKLKEVIEYRELLWMFVKRNFITMYKQTVLGPLWIVITPIISTLISTFVFGNIAKIQSDGLPYFLFYLCGYGAWTYFASCLTKTSSTFVSNASIFGKVYFPRLTMPISSVISGLINYGINIIILIICMVYFSFNGVAINPDWGKIWFLFPLTTIQLALLGLGFGIIISSMTTKYRDLNVLISFGVSLWMYITPVIYPVSSLEGKLKTLSLVNPVGPAIEIQRHIFFGTGEIPYLFWGISWITTIVVLLFGILIFNKVERTFMDTV